MPWVEFREVAGLEVLRHHVPLLARDDKAFLGEENVDPPRARSCMRFNEPQLASPRVRGIAFRAPFARLVEFARPNSATRGLGVGLLSGIAAIGDRHAGQHHVGVEITAASGATAKEPAIDIALADLTRHAFL